MHHPIEYICVGIVWVIIAYFLKAGTLHLMLNFIGGLMILGGIFDLITGRRIR